MKNARRKILYSVILAFATAAITGCGNDESSAKSQESFASSGDKWFVAGNVEQAYRSQIQMDALNAGKKPFEATQVAWQYFQSLKNR